MSSKNFNSSTSSRTKFSSSTSSGTRVLKILVLVPVLKLDNSSSTTKGVKIVVYLN